ncbi:MAG: U32 family peptidase [Silvanigrellales bacterium]|nr:U32 family peptidase [Silvanigrellales bacterium]
MNIEEAQPDGLFIPEILAPAGGREQFFAALHSGADAVFLGLKKFNARARAENFSTEDLRELLPLAKKHGMKVLVTLNVLVKQCELPDLVGVLATLEDLEVDALIVQDIAVASLARRFFPGLRLHASTQLAVHNLAGVKVARALGFRRVVLARELTAQDLRGIRKGLPRDEVEIEAFCHGSLCYSYSGLCFFSGAQDSRSGNRGECAYTCRKPYKVLSEPGQGFLFSMRDLDTVDDLDALVNAGVDTLKIEGRKKDAQYVSTVVKSYRAKLDMLAGRDTLRPEAPAAAREKENLADLERDMGLTFHRERTSFFLKGRYHENVIDLDNPTHKGIRVGEVLKVDDRWVRLVLECDIERFDGLRIDPSHALYHAKPQHLGEAPLEGRKALEKKYEGEVLQFSLREMRARGRRIPTAVAGEQVEFELPEGATAPRAGDVVFKTRSAALRARIEKISKPGANEKPVPLRFADIRVEVAPLPQSLLAVRCRVSKHGHTVLSEELIVPAVRPKRAATLEDDLRSQFTLWGNVGVVAKTLDVVSLSMATFTEVTEATPGVNSEATVPDFHWFVPRSKLKELKNAVGMKLGEALDAAMAQKAQAALSHMAASAGSSPLQIGTPRFSVKCDRLETLEALHSFLQEPEVQQSRAQGEWILDEVVFEPKRMFLSTLDATSLAASVVGKVEALGARLRVAVPTVVRAWDEALLKRWMAAFAAAGVHRFEVGNVGAFALLDAWVGALPSPLDLASDFTLYALNNEAAQSWSELGVSKIALSIESDARDLALQLDSWPRAAGRPQAILYKDTPLFIAESCSLTALHNGCPSAEVCGYRSLEVENEEGERFLVAHENCKSVVYGKDAFSLTQERSFFAAHGVSDFRIDFLTRPYSESAIHSILRAGLLGEKVVAGASAQMLAKGAHEAPNTHTANFHRTLL